MSKKVNGEDCGNWIDIEKLRNENKPGCYKWWAKEKEFRSLLVAINRVSNEKIFFKDIKSELEESDGYYCIYIGKANRIYQRLGNHILGKVNNSTLRKTIAGLILTNKRMKLEELEKKVNTGYIDKFKVKAIFLKGTFKTAEELKEKLKTFESKLINAPFKKKNGKKSPFFRLLNSDVSKHDKVDITRNAIKKAREKV